MTFHWVCCEMFAIYPNHPSKKGHMKSLKKDTKRSNAKERVEAYDELVSDDFTLNTRLLLIQQLIPLGLLAVEESLQSEVEKLAGVRYSREGNIKRWGLVTVV